MTPVNPIALALRVAAILDQLRIPYVIGGSVAASIYGEPRSTLDLDLMIDANESQIQKLVEALKPDFYVDEKAALDALSARTSFNAIHFESSTRIDFFFPEAEAFVEAQFARRRAITVVAGERQLSFYAPEDLIVRKLLWYRAGESERQWRDVIGILRIASLDIEYLRKAALAAGVSDLLDRAVGESQG